MEIVQMPPQLRKHLVVVTATRSRLNKKTYLLCFVNVKEQQNMYMKNVLNLGFYRDLDTLK